MFIGYTMTKRINKTLRQFFEEKPLTDWEKDFIIGCVNASNKFLLYPNGTVVVM